MSRISDLPSREYGEIQLKAFRRYRDTYTDDLPQKRILPGDPRYDEYKCRTNFFSAVYTRVNLLIIHGLLPDQFSWFEDYMERDRDWHEMATSDDIALINRVISEVISILETSETHSK